MPGAAKWRIEPKADRCLINIDVRSMASCRHRTVRFNVLKQLEAMTPLTSADTVELQGLVPHRGWFCHRRPHQLQGLHDRVRLDPDHG